MKIRYIVFIPVLFLLLSCKSKKDIIKEHNNGSVPDILATELLAEQYDNNNIALSPLSISSAMSMLHLGASGVTRVELEDVLHLPDNDPAFHKNMGHSLRKLKTDSLNTIVNVANGIWIDENYNVQNEYLDKLQLYYDANLSEVNFKEASARTSANKNINQWISEKTNNKIKDLIPLGAFNALTRLVLVNAVYFKSEWLYPFVRSANTTEDFTTADGVVETATYMNQQKTFRHLKKDNYQLLELPYQHNQFSMLFFLPEKDDSIPTVLNKINTKVIDSLFVNQPVLVDLKLPKFTVDYKTSLNQTLQDMGLQSAFTDAANFEGISERNDLKVTDVFHGAVVEVNEKGTEAAGATGVVAGIKSAPAGDPVHFYLNRPFVFVIYHKEEKQILFAGTFARP